MGEFDLIEWIRSHSAGGERAPIGIGDDCASLRFAHGRDVLVTSDMLLDGRHFRLATDSPEQVGYKSLAVNLSDMAAMAGQPVAAVVSVALPRARASEIGRRLHEGMNPLLERFGVLLVGGDTNAWEGPLVVSIALLGEATERGPVRRLGAQSGDAILVTGPLGGSLLGRHLRPKPRVREALAIHQRTEIRAMIDLSDGLSSDLGHILDESGGLGAILDTASLPIHRDAQILSQVDGRLPLDHALDDGEDFELCLTLAEKDAASLLDNPPCPLSRIGIITSEPGIRLRFPDGRIEARTRAGFDHFRDSEGDG